MERYRQVSPSDDYRWPSGWPRAAATFAVTPEVVTARTGLAFEAGVDELDYYRGVGLDLPSGRRVELIWYERTPIPGLVLQADAAENLEAVRIEVMDALGISEAEVQWTPEPDPPAG